jgi:hypothetical protein
MPVRSRLGRIAGLLFAAWFTVFQTEPAVVHACAMHGAASGHGAHGQLTAAGANLSNAADAHTSHEAGAAEPATPDDESGATCTCPGGCAAASTVAIPGATEAAIAEAAILNAATLRTHHETFLAADADHVLPFANGPPTA